MNFNLFVFKYLSLFDTKSIMIFPNIIIVESNKIKKEYITYLNNVCSKKEKWSKISFDSKRKMFKYIWVNKIYNNNSLVKSLYVLWSRKFNIYWTNQLFNVLKPNEIFKLYYYFYCNNNYNLKYEFELFCKQENIKYG